MATSPSVRRLAVLVRGALSEGRLSFSKVRALCRVVKPENEEFLLGLTMDMTAAQLERHVRNYGAARVRSTTPAAWISVAASRWRRRC